MRPDFKLNKEFWPKGPGFSGQNKCSPLFAMFTSMEKHIKLAENFNPGPDRSPILYT